MLEIKSNETALQPFKSIFLCLFFAFSCASTNSFAQKTEGTGINIGAQFGASKLQTETNFSESFHEFYNTSGATYNIELSKYLNPKWEIGAQVDFSVLKGDNNNPDFSANDKHDAMSPGIEKPVKYHNKLTGQNFFFRYYFTPNNVQSGFTPFVRAGVGYINYLSEFNYKDPSNGGGDDVIFGKGSENGSKLSTAVYIVGAGFKTSINGNWFLLTTFDLNFVDYDFLDVVHNYDPKGNRMKLIGVYSQIKVGILYTTSGNQIKSKSRKTSKRKNVPTKSHLPFSK